MTNPPDDTNTEIILSPAILEHLSTISGASLRTYIYLCSCNGKPVCVAVSDIQAVTGLERRSVLKAIRILRELKLINTVRGKGHRPNTYLVPVPTVEKRLRDPQTAMNETSAAVIPTEHDTTPVSGALPGQQLGNQRLPVPTARMESLDAQPQNCPIPASLTSSEGKALPRADEGESQAQANLEHLVGATYRVLSDDEQLELNEWLAAFRVDRQAFWDRLKRFKERGEGVTEDLSLGFFVRCVMQHAA
jgi:hypothetical protein